MDRSRRAVLAAAGALATGLAGCTAGSSDFTPTGTPTRQAAPTTFTAGGTYHYTTLQATGNRVLDGSGELGESTPTVIPVDGTPAWVLGIGADRWIVGRTNGRATTYRLGEAGSEPIAEHATVATPPVACRTGETVTLVTPPEDIGRYTHPVFSGSGRLYIAAGGDLVIDYEDRSTRLGVAAPEDARIVAIGDGRYALYGSRTDRYRHGALGDDTEGSSLLVVDAARGRIETEIDLDPPAVFEGLSPLVADIDGDGMPEIVTTVATAEAGARIRVYATDGTELGTGPAPGSGWRHQLCVAPFGPDGRVELAAVRKPHVDHVLEFYRLVDGRLDVVATREGYSTHTYGSRTLDAALGADLTGADRPAVLLPTADRRRLETVRRVAGGTERAGSLVLEGRLATNVAGVTRADGGLAVGAGTTDAVRIWHR